MFGSAVTWERIAAAWAVRSAPFDWRLRKWLSPHYWLGLLGYHAAHLFSRLAGVVTITSRLRAKDVTQGIDYGWIGHRCVTTVGVVALMREWYDGPNVMKNFKYMGVGTSSAVESASDTSLGAAIEDRDSSTIYLVGAGNAFSVVSEHTYAGIYTLREHGLFNASSGGSLFDRTMFSSIVVGSGTVIEWTYEIEASAGS